MNKLFLTTLLCLCLQSLWAIEVDPGADRLVKPEEFPIILGGEEYTAKGGSGIFQYQWRSEPAGFFSTEARPMVSPETTTTYFLKVRDSDGFECKEVSVTILVGELNITVDSNNDLRVDGEDDGVEDESAFVFWTYSPNAIKTFPDIQINDKILEDLATIRIAIPENMPDHVELQIGLESSEVILPKISIFEKIGSGLQYLLNPATGKENLERFKKNYLFGNRIISNEDPESNKEIIYNSIITEFLFFASQDGNGKIVLSLNIDGKEIERDEAKIEIFDIHHAFNGDDPQLFSIANFRPGRLRWGTLQKFKNLRTGPITMVVHGYNVPEEKAMNDWYPNLYKRMYWTGVKSDLLGITWEGDEGRLFGVSAEFNENIFNAFFAAPDLADFINLNFREDQRVDIFAHSLGNILVSQALKNTNNGIINHYILHEAAVPANAYDALGSNGEPLELIARWDILWEEDNTVVVDGFPQVNERLNLTMADDEEVDDNEDLWVGYFSSILKKEGTKLINTFSAKDDVLKNIWSLNEQIFKEDFTDSDFIADLNMPSEDSLATREIALLSHIFPGRSRAMGGIVEANEIPPTYFFINGEELGINGHSAFLERPFFHVYPFFRKLLERGFLFGTIETITP